MVKVKRIPGWFQYFAQRLQPGKNNHKIIAASFDLSTENGRIYRPGICLSSAAKDKKHYLPTLGNGCVFIKQYINTVCLAFRNGVFHTRFTT